MPIIGPEQNPFRGRKGKCPTGLQRTAEWANRTFLTNDKYLAMYKRSVDGPALFWGEMGKRIDWIKPYTKIKITFIEAAIVALEPGQGRE